MSLLETSFINGASAPNPIATAYTVLANERIILKEIIAHNGDGTNTINLKIYAVASGDSANDIKNCILDENIPAAVGANIIKRGFNVVLEAGGTLQWIAGTAAKIGVRASGYRSV